MEAFPAVLNGIANPAHRARIEEVLAWVAGRFPQLGTRVAWGQPMFTHHDTIILSLKPSKKHLGIVPETLAIEHFADRIAAAGYESTHMIIRIPWDKPVDYALLEALIEYNIRDKADCKTFWRAS
jgi:uncharacterized protein YdhG (YjbR/CyaY superfamily)